MASNLLISDRASPQINHLQWLGGSCKCMQMSSRNPKSNRKWTEVNQCLSQISKRNPKKSAAPYSISLRVTSAIPFETSQSLRFIRRFLQPTDRDKPSTSKHTWQSQMRSCFPSLTSIFKILGIGDVSHYSYWKGGWSVPFFGHPMARFQSWFVSSKIGLWSTSPSLLMKGHHICYNVTYV